MGGCRSRSAPPPKTTAGTWPASGPTAGATATSVTFPDELAAIRTRESFDERVADTTVAAIGGEVAGFVTIAGDEVEQVYVDAAHRGTGVASALLATRAGDLIAPARHGRQPRVPRMKTVDEAPSISPSRYSPVGPLPLPCHRYAK